MSQETAFCPALTNARRAYPWVTPTADLRLEALQAAVWLHLAGASTQGDGPLLERRRGGVGATQTPKARGFTTTG